MTSRDFCYWLQGYFEITMADHPNGGKVAQLGRGQVENIQKHLAMVFVHEIDPSFGEDQSKLNQLHSDKPNSGLVARC
jgi:hypothetical protein